MAGTGDITIDGINITPEGFQRISTEVASLLKSTSKDPSEFRVVDSLANITTIPVFWESGKTFELVRVMIEALRGLDGKSVSLRKQEGRIEWMQGEDGVWQSIVSLDDIKGQRGDKIVLRLGEEGIEWKQSEDEDSEYKVLIALSELKGEPGDNVELRKSEIALEWKLSSEQEEAFKTLLLLSEIRGDKGEPGKNLELRKSGSSIEYKLEGEADTEYKLLVALSDLKGDVGKNIVLRKGTTAIEWKVFGEADSTYKTLVPLSEITGPKGERGEKFAVLGYYDTLSLLQTGVPKPTPGDAYGVGTATPYKLYVWDAIKSRWVDNGSIGLGGSGTGNVYIDPVGLKAGKKYIFMPGSDNSATGTYVELSLADFVPTGYELLLVKKEV